MGKLFKISIVLVIIIISSSCDRFGHRHDRSNLTDEQAQARADSIEQVKMLQKCDTFGVISYRNEYISSKEQLQSILDAHNDAPENMVKNRAFCLLNRKARYFMRVGDTLVIPERYENNRCAYSIFPQYYHGAKDIPKLVVVSNHYQCYAAYENGVQVHFAACNTGKETTPTYPGRYAFVWRDLLHKSSLDSEWVMPFTWNFHQYAGCAFHQFTMPGYAASHSCIRQFREDAQWLYYWVKGAKVRHHNYVHLSGTPIIVIDIFDFSRRHTGPWVSLKSNKDIVLELPKNPMEVEDAVIPICQIPVGSRGGLPHRSTYIHGEDTLRARGVIRPGVVLTPTVNFNHRRRDELQAKQKKELEDIKKIDELKKLEELQKVQNETMMPQAKPQLD
ncbi:MAG: L,D-transpeptidase [bacterium]